MTAVIGLYAPVAKSVGNVADAAIAGNVASVLGDELARRVLPARSFADVAALLKVADDKGGHQLTAADNNPNAAGSDPRTDPQLLFVSRDGSKIGGYADPVWGGSDLDKYFEVALMRNEALSPNHPENDATASFLVYTARIRWPAFVPDNTLGNLRRALPAGYNPGAALRFDRSQQQVLVIAGSVTR